MSAPESSITPFLAASRRFSAAVQQYLSQCAAGAGPAAGETFARFLREESAVLHAASPWETPQPPALGLTREHQQRTQRASGAFGQMAEAGRRLQMLWFDALRDAAADFAARLDDSAAGVAADPATLRRLYDRWIDSAEAAYARVAHGDAFCSALADFVNAGSRWRSECAAQAAHGSAVLDLPTRSEINSLTRRLKAVEEELRAAVPRPHPKKKRAATKRRPKT